MTRQIFALIAMLGVSTVYADDYVNSADGNGDGFVSLYELRAAYYADPEFNKRIEQSFEDYDRNGDGLISEDERQAARPGIAAEAGAQVGNQKTGAGPVVGAFQDESKSTSQGQTRNDIRSDAAASEGSSELDAARQLNPGYDTGGAGAADRGGQNLTRDDGANGRTAAWIMEIDADNSGGASIAELVASGGGTQWFTDQEFNAADRNGDGDLDAAELAGLVSSLERRHR